MCKFRGERKVPTMKNFNTECNHTNCVKMPVVSFNYPTQITSDNDKKNYTSK